MSKRACHLKQECFKMRQRFASMAYLLHTASNAWTMSIPEHAHAMQPDESQIQDHEAGALQARDAALGPSGRWTWLPQRHRFAWRREFAPLQGLGGDLVNLPLSAYPPPYPPPPPPPFSIRAAA